MVAINGHVNARKPLDTPRTVTAVLADDPDLKFAVKSGETWWFHIVGFLTTVSATPDIKLAMNGPAITDLRYSMHIGEHTGAPGPYEEVKTAWLSEGTVNFVGAANDDFEIYGVLTAAANGTVVLQWAQKTSSADATVVKRGSTLRAVRLN